MWTSGLFKAESFHSGSALWLTGGECDLVVTFPSEQMAELDKDRGSGGMWVWVLAQHWPSIRHWTNCTASRHLSCRWEIHNAQLIDSAGDQTRTYMQTLTLKINWGSLCHLLDGLGIWLRYPIESSQNIHLNTFVPLNEWASMGYRKRTLSPGLHLLYCPQDYSFLPPHHHLLVPPVSLAPLEGMSSQRLVSNDRDETLYLHPQDLC